MFLKVLHTSALVLSIVFSQIAIGQNENTKAKISTRHGDIIIKLYDDTPSHRDNFIKLVEEGVYDSTLFHRVIKQFMIQGGDPDSKGAAQGANLGDGGPGYTLPAEIVDHRFHKRGALAAARKGDNVNPEKRSSGSQFYIVDGRKFTLDDLMKFEQSMNMRKKQSMYQLFFEDPENREMRDSIVACQQRGDMAGITKINNQVLPIIEKEYAEGDTIKISDDQIKAYTELGGAPHLDGGYTVFGEVIQGMEVVDKIAAEPVSGPRPITDVAMTITILKDDK